MQLVDTSCWVDYLRGSGTPAAVEVRRLVRDELSAIAICEPVAMELLAGSSSTRVQVQVERLVNGLTTLPFDASTDFRTAAAVQRAAREQGLVVRNMVDCLIAAVSLRTGVPVLHKDADFETIAQVTPLQALSLR